MKIIMHPLCSGTTSGSNNNIDQQLADLYQGIYSNNNGLRSVYDYVLSIKKRQSSSQRARLTEATDDHVLKL